MEIATASKNLNHLKENQSERVREAVWLPIDSIRKNQRLFSLDYAVREEVKKQLTGHLSYHMDTLVEKGLTYEELLEIQSELELCPSVLEFYPGKQSWSARLWHKFSLALGLL